ncbi:MAG: 2-oxoacid:acceptor oxidoreductase family protein [Candidatus Omnitrophica bacterium]|nr:2-oxoacid:acceptor oxidoreductase family protein [Candidatus Omnitrophota bacterium]
MTEKIIIAGSGGQGIMLLGKVIVQAALLGGLNITWLPSYGAEVRGGAAYCMVIISSEEIFSPYVEKADTLIIMNQPSLLKFKQRLKHKGLLLINSSLLRTPPKEGLNKIYFPFTEEAIKLGNIRIANMLALGGYIQKKKVLSKALAFRAIEEIAPAGKKNLIKINKKAIEEGIRITR